MSQSNNKPHYLQESDTVGRGDGGERVPVVSAESQRVQAYEVLEEIENLGIPLEDVQKALAGIRSDLQRPGGTKIFAAIRIVIDWLITAQRTPADVGKRVLVVAHLLETPHATTTLGQLAIVIGKGKTTAHNQVKQVNGELADLLKNLIKKPSGSEQSTQY